MTAGADEARSAERWNWTSLGDLFEIQQGKALSPTARRGINPRPFLRTANVLWGRLSLADVDEMDFSAEEEARYQLAADDLLVCEGGEIGRTAIWSGELEACYYQNHLHRLRRSRPDVDPAFVMYWMQYAVLIGRLYAGRGNETTIANLSKSRLAAFEIPHPPPGEQRAIAHVLGTVQRARAQTEQVIAGARQLKQSLRERLLTDGSDWPLVPLGELLREPLRNGHSAPATSDQRGVRTLTLTAVTQNDFSAKNTKITSADPNSVANLWLEPGDIFVERANTRELVGLAALYEGPGGFAIFPDLLIRVRPDPAKLLPKFAVEYLMSSTVRHRFQRNASGTAGNMPKIDQRLLAATLISVPPLARQAEVAAALSAADRKIAAELERRNALDALSSSLLRDLMNERLRVDRLIVESSV